MNLVICIFLLILENSLPLQQFKVFWYLDILTDFPFNVKSILFGEYKN